LRKIGAKWYADKRDYTRSSVEMRQREWDVLLGWPEEGGVWVLRAFHSQAALEGWGRIGNARTTKERCEVIEMLGESFSLIQGIIRSLNF
jgi:hypothetical protein